MSKIRLNLTPIQIVMLNKETYNSIINNEFFYEIEKYVTNLNTDNVEMSVLELYVDAVKHILKKETKSDILAIRNVSHLSFLNEELGLEVLKNRSPRTFKDIKPYDLPKSHTDYINSFNDEDRMVLKNTFFESYLTDIKFIPSVNKITFDIKTIKLHDKNTNTHYDAYYIPYSSSYSYISWGTPVRANSFDRVLFFKDYETAQKVVSKIIDLTYEIDVKKQKLSWEVNNPKNYTYFKVPYIRVVRGEEIFSTTILEDFKSTFTVLKFSFVENVMLTYSVDDIFYSKGESISSAYDSLADLYKQKANELDIPISGGYCPANQYKILSDCVKKYLSEVKDEYNNIIQPELTKKGLVGELNIVSDKEFNVILTITDEESSFETKTLVSDRKYNTIDSIIDSIKLFNIRNFKLSHNYNQLKNRYILSKSNIPKL
jgi:hypothetical protein